MADDLENEWWLQGEVKTSDSEDDKSETDQTLTQDTVIGEEKKKKKRKKKNMKGSFKPLTGSQCVEKQAVIEGAQLQYFVTIRTAGHSFKDFDFNMIIKRYRHTITQELQEKGDTPATPSDVKVALERFFEGKLSPVEWDELQLSEDDHFYSQNNSSLGFAVAYLKSILPKWKKLKRDASTSPGSPLLLILTSSALRAVQLNRQINVFKGEDCKCAKLFAKHMKLEEQQKFLKKAVCHVGIGTPNRVLALLKSGHLKLEKLKALVFDWNWRDIKQRRLVDVPEVRSDLFLLLQTQLIPHIKSSVNCKIGIL